MAPASYERFARWAASPAPALRLLCALGVVCIYMCMFVRVYVCMCVRELLRVRVRVFFMWVVCMCSCGVCAGTCLRVCLCVSARVRVANMHGRTISYRSLLTTPRRRCRFFDQYQQYQESRDPPRDALGPQIGALDHRYSSASTSARGIEVICAAGNRLGPRLSFWHSPRMQTCSPRVWLLWTNQGAILTVWCVCAWAQYCYHKGPGMQKWTLPGRAPESYTGGLILCICKHAHAMQPCM